MSSVVDIAEMFCSRRCSEETVGAAGMKCRQSGQTGLRFRICSLGRQLLMPCWLKACQDLLDGEFMVSVPRGEIQCTYLKVSDNVYTETLKALEPIPGIYLIRPPNYPLIYHY